MHLSNQSLLVILIVGIVAGYLAGRIMEGGGFGLIGDLIVGIIGGIGANLLANYFNVHFAISGHPIISQIIIAFFGAVILLMILFGMGRGLSRARAY